MALAYPERTWTYEDLLALPDDGKRYEIVEGVLFERPAPSLAHARILARLFALLLPVIARLRGEALFAPLDVFIPGGDPVQPDLVAILPGSAARGVPNGIQGPPDLVVEILSPTTRGYDALTKRALYGRAGVREYWLVDPETRTIEVQSLQGNALVTTGVFAGEDAISSGVLPECGFAMADLFSVLDEPTPAPEAP